MDPLCDFRLTAQNQGGQYQKDKADAMSILG